MLKRILLTLALLVGAAAIMPGPGQAAPVATTAASGLGAGTAAEPAQFYRRRYRPYRRFYGPRRFRRPFVRRFYGPRFRGYRRPFRRRVFRF